MNAVDSAHTTGAHVDASHAHPGPRQYVMIAVILAIITAIEVGLYYVDLAKGLLITLLILLAGIKFTMVLMFFMHLKFDSKIFSWFFASAMAVAGVAFFVVLAMFRFFAA